MKSNTPCGCDTAPRLIFPCSGGADTGALTDRAARALTREGSGKMACLAGIGGGVAGMILSARAAGAVLAIDGCAVGCASKCLEKAGITGLHQLRLDALGFEKGSSPVTPENIEKVCAEARPLLRGSRERCNVLEKETDHAARES
ncbi:MAG TPA: putative zinc-binding protein [Candidatus Hydrogenedentes bacterium]|nr:putative zinc-binding protein [Candidatus Hydrogenedentota bacterium]